MWGKLSQRDYKNKLIKLFDRGQYRECYKVAKEFYGQPFYFEPDEKILIAAAFRIEGFSLDMPIIQRFEEDALRRNIPHVLYAFVEYRIYLAKFFAAWRMGDKAEEALREARENLASDQRRRYKQALKIFRNLGGDYKFKADILKLDW